MVLKQDERKQTFQFIKITTMMLHLLPSLSTLSPEFV